MQCRVTGFLALRASVRYAQHVQSFQAITKARNLANIQQGRHQRDSAERTDPLRLRAKSGSLFKFPRERAQTREPFASSRQCPNPLQVHARSTYPFEAARAHHCEPFANIVKSATPFNALARMCPAACNNCEPLSPKPENLEKCKPFQTNARKCEPFATLRQKREPFRGLCESANPFKGLASICPKVRTLCKSSGKREPF